MQKLFFNHALETILVSNSRGEEVVGKKGI